ncbi:MAG TPA: hypothetical protein IAC74_01275 [Candidatus Aphodoplasma excrementigallinarum]|uniref:Uncharacterized protein n=1 Tax=Candidatus Aphodoplasma excrementigallinarum TaxID=2840673 RepID=A0A9D1NGL1_9FIRM|nr:hypothetical protein [Candidatus Aphodoplasma excrementigallinarum]
MNVTPPVYIKPFSKKWWENVWYYYKWFIVGGIIVVILLIMLLAECVFNVQPDFTVTYIGGMENMGQVEAYQLEDRFSTVTEDINGDGQQAAKVNIIYLDNNNASEEMAAMYSMADIEMAGGDAVVFLISEAFLDRYADYGFIDLSEYVQEFGIDESLLRYDANGNPYAIEMRDNPIFTDLESVKTEGLFLAVRPLRANDQTTWQQDNYENGLAMARYIISGGTAMPQ